MLPIEIKYNGKFFSNGEDKFAESLCTDLKKNLIEHLQSFGKEIQLCSGRVIIDIAKNLACRVRLEHMPEDLKHRITTVLKSQAIQKA
jgi:hypothetical protein